MKKAVQTRVRKLRATEYKKLSSQIDKMPRSKRNAARKVVKKRLMKFQKDLFAKMTGSKRMNLADLKKFVSRNIKF